MSKVRVFPVADLLPYLEQKATQLADPGRPDQMTSTDGGRRKLARMLADRVGGTFEARYRTLGRLMNGHQDVITTRLADELAIGIGLHPQIVWPQLWSQAS